MSLRRPHQSRWCMGYAAAGKRRSAKRRPARRLGLSTFERALGSAKLAFVPGGYESLLAFETLETRSLLAASPLVVDLSADTQGDDVLASLDTSGTNLQVTVNGILVQNVPLANVSYFSIVGSTYGDDVTISLTHGDPVPVGGLHVTGGLGFTTAFGNSLSIAGGNSEESAIYQPLGPHSGHITLGSAMANVSFENMDDVFVDAKSVEVDGTNGNDSITYAQVPFGAGTVTVNDLAPIHFNFESTLVINSHSGNDTIILDPRANTTGLTNIYVSGSQSARSSATLVVNGTGKADGITVNPTNARSAEITGPGPAIHASDVDQLVVNGQGGNVPLTYKTSGPSALLTFTPGATANSGTIQGRYTADGGGGALLPISYTNIALGGSLTFSHAPFEGQSARRDLLTVDGTAGNDAFSAGSGQVSLYQAATASSSTPLSTTLPIYTPGVASLTLAGLGGVDIFYVDGAAPSALPYPTFIDGSGATDPPAVNLYSDGTATTTNLGAGEFSTTEATVTGGGLGTVTMSGVGVINVYDGGANAKGTGGMTVTGQPTTPENFVVTPEAGGAEIQDMNPNPVFNLGPTVNYVGAGAVSVAADSPLDGDTLTVAGAGGDNSITATSTQITVNNFTPVHYSSTSLARLVIKDTGGGDTLAVDATGGPVAVPVFFDGGTASNILVLQGGFPIHDFYDAPGSGQTTQTDLLEYAAGDETVESSTNTEVRDTMAGSMTIFGTPGNDAITYRGNSGGAQVTIDGLPELFIPSKSDIFIDAGGGNHTFNVDNTSSPPGLSSLEFGGSNSITIHGGANSNVDVAPTDAHSATITGAGSIPITVFRTNQLTIDGDQSPDNLTYTSPAGVGSAINFVPGATVNSGAIDASELATAGASGPPLLPVSYANIALGGSLTFAHSGGGRTDDFSMSGNGAKQDFAIGSLVANELDYFNGNDRAALPIIAQSITGMLLDGSAGQAVFNVSPNSILRFTLVGNGSADPTTANLAGDGSPIIANLGDATQAIGGRGFGQVVLSGIADVNLFLGGGILTVAGVENGKHNLVVTPSGASAATIEDNGAGPVVKVTGANSSGLVVDLPGTGNTLTVDGSPGGNVMAATNTQVTVFPNIPVNYSASQLSSLTVNGVGGVNSLSVDSTAAPVITPLFFDGGPGGLSEVSFSGGTADSDRFIPGPNPGQGTDAIVFGGQTEQVTFARVRDVSDFIAAATLMVTGAPGGGSIQYRGEGGDAGFGDVSVNNFPSLIFDGKSALDIDGMTGNTVVGLDTNFAVRGLQAISVNAFGPIDKTSNTTVVINGGQNQNINVSPTDAHTATVTGAGAVPISLNAVNQLTIDGDQSGDNLTIITPAGDPRAVTLTPGPTHSSGSLSVSAPFSSAGSALLPLKYINFANASSLTLAHAGGVRVDSFNLSGTPAFDNFVVGGDSVYLFGPGGAATLAVHTPGIATLSLDGSASQASFFVTAPLAYTITTLVGNGSTDPVVASFVADGTAAKVFFGTTEFQSGLGTGQALTGGGLGTVFLGGVATINLNANGGAVTATGIATGNNNLAVTPTGTQAATVQDNGQGPVVNVTGAAMAGLTVSLSGGSNVLTVSAPAASFSITATNNLVAVDSNLPVKYAAADLAKLVMSGAGGLTVDSTSGPVTTPLTYLSTAVQSTVSLVGTADSEESYFPGSGSNEGELRAFFPKNVLEDIQFSGGPEARVFDTIASPALVVNGTSGNDTISYTTNSKYGGVSVDALPTMYFANKTSLEIDTGQGTSTTNLDTQVTPPGLNQIFVNGITLKSSSNVVTINGGTNQSLSYLPFDAHDATIAGAGAVPIILGGVDRVTIDGNQSADNLTVVTPAGDPRAVTLTPGPTHSSGSLSVSAPFSSAGSALLPLDYTNFANTGSLTLAHAGGGRQDFFNLSGAAAFDNFFVGNNSSLGIGNDSVLLLGPGVQVTLVVHTPGIDRLSLDGSASQASFFVAAPLPYTFTTLVGNGSTDPAVATLTGDGTAANISFATATFTSGFGTGETLTGGGLGTVTLDGVANINLDAKGGAVTTTGASAGNNNLSVAPTGPQAAAVQDNGQGPVVNVTGAASGGINISLPGNGNALLVNVPIANTSMHDIFYMTATNSQIITLAQETVAPFTGTNYLPVNYNAANLARVTVLGGFELTVDSTSGPVITPLNYVSSGTASNSGSVGLTGSASVVTAYQPGPAAGQGLLVSNFTGASESVRFQNVGSIFDNQASQFLSVFGTPGDDTISYEGNSLAGSLTVDNFPTLLFSAQGTLDLFSQEGNDTINLNTAQTPSGLTAVNVIGTTISTGNTSANNDSVIINGGTNQNINYAPSDAHSATISGAGTVSISLSNVNHVTIDGNQSGDNLTVITPAGDPRAVTLTPGATFSSGSVAVSAPLTSSGGSALLPLDYTNFGNTGSLTLAHAGGGRQDFFNLSGAAAFDNFFVGNNSSLGIGNDSVLLLGPGVQATLVVHTPGIDRLSLDGSASQASFFVAAPLAYTFTTLVGNGSTDPAVATLTGDGTAANISFATATFTSGFGTGETLTGGGLGTVTLDGVANIKLAAATGDINVTGTASAALNVTPTDLNAATIHLGAELVVNATNTGALVINGATQVVLDSSAKSNLFTVDEVGRAATVQSGGASLKSVTLGATVSDLTVVGGPANDTFQVIPARNTGRNDIVGSPAFQVPSNLLVQVSGGGGANDTLLVSGPGGATLLGGSYGANGLFAVIDRASATQGTVRLFQQSGGAEPIQYPDISYSNVQRVQANTPGAGGFAAQTLVLGPDPYDPNGSPATADYLGSAATINAANLAIFPNAYENGSPIALGPEHDWFRVVAQATGTLDFQVYFTDQPGFLPGKGELQIDVYDASGKPITGFGSNNDTSDQRRRIPAVAGETYYLHVSGALNTTINEYSLSVINTPAPKPDSVQLNTAGNSNVTSSSTPLIDIRLDAANTPSDGLADLSAGGTSSGLPPDNKPILIPFWPASAATAPNAPANNGSFRIAVYDETNPQSSVLLGYANAMQPGVFTFQPAAPLADGNHTLVAKVEFDSPSAIAATDVGPGTPLSLLVESHAPAVSFGTPGAPGSGLDAASDTGVPGQPATLADLITSASTPKFYGTAAMGSTVRLYFDADNDGVVNQSDPLIGQIVVASAGTFDPTVSEPWQATANVDVNSPTLGVPLDGVRMILATATDAAGNVATAKPLSLFLDTQGPRVSVVSVTGNPSYSLFADKTAAPAPTPLVNSLDIAFSELPTRGGGFVFPAVNKVLATSAGNYQLVGEATGPVTISSVTFADNSVSGKPGQSVVTLHFAKPLADDRYTLTASDHITDDAGNALDGEFGGAFPSGDGSPGGSFAGMFTVNSRPHLGTVSSAGEAIDLNGNFVFDPQNPDAKNRDAMFAFGFPTDHVFAGKFADSKGMVSGFDKFAAYGFSAGHWRWLFDASGDGKFDASTGDFSTVEPFVLRGTPVAANFDGKPADGDQVGLFDGKTWWLDVLNHHTIDQADVAAGGKLTGDMRGQPIVGDFDGDGKVDLATYDDGTLYFDLSSKDPGGKLTGNWNTTIDVSTLLRSVARFTDQTIDVVAADMDGDGITDVGFYLPGNDGQTASWYWLISNDAQGKNRVPGTVDALDHPFDPTPLDSDLFAQFGSAGATPLVGLFDPPPDGGAAGDPTPVLSGEAAWINKEYIDVLGRQPAAGELNYWVAQLDQGETPAALAQAILESDEHLAAVINQLYQQYLGRAADAAGTQYWTAVWRQSGGPEQVQAGIIGSPEYYKTAHTMHPQLSADQAWVTALYQNLLGRDVDQQGLAYWVNYIQTHTKQSVVLGFVTSDEYRLGLIDSWFTGDLGRSVDSSAAQYWLNQMKAGVSQDAIQIGILSNHEFTHS